MEKNIKIDIPEGYEIDKEKSTFTEIVLKEKEKRPETWDEFCKMGFTGKEYTFGAKGFVKTGHIKNDPRHPSDIKYVPDERCAKAFQAMFQLMSLRSAWIGDWSPIYIKENNSESYPIDESRYEKWHIVFDNCWPWVEKGHEKTRALSFPTKKMAEDFLECFRDLISLAYGLI